MFFTYHPGSVPLMRSQIRQTVRGWGYDRGTAAATELIAAELAGNAVLHGVGGYADRFEVRLTPHISGLTLEVRDGNPAFPVLQEGSELEESGRGLLLVQALSQRWGAARSTRGKSTWALIAAETRSSKDAQSPTEALTPK